MIELKNVRKTYGSGGFALFPHNIVIGEGEIVGVLGGNGSGKTTLLKAIMGIGELQYGEILLDGRPVTEQYDKIAFITEEGSFLPNTTPNQYADFLAGFYSSFDRNYYAKLLDFFELDPHGKIKAFSRGQKSKLEICAGFSKGAKYILMDEPFLGKDMFARRDFLKLMVANLQGEETVLLATHLIDDIENVMDRAIILHRGSIKADLAIDDMREGGKTLPEVMAKIAGYQEESYKRVLK